MWNLKKKDTNELICRRETDSQNFKDLWLPKGTDKWGGKHWGVWDWYMHTKVYGMIG